MTTPKPLAQPDEDAALGVVEDDSQTADRSASQVSHSGQIGHRDQDSMLKDSDSDFPEPDALGEHSGERHASA